MSQHPRWLEAIDAVTDLRGGVELCRFVATLAGVADVREVHLDDSRWFANPDGFAAVLGSAQRFAVIYVTPSARRRKIGTQLWAQIEQQYPDALLLALPGERGIKSLGEAVGMTARFIAMGGK